VPAERVTRGNGRQFHDQRAVANFVDDETARSSRKSADLIVLTATS